MQYLLSIDSPESQREVMALLARFADVTVAPAPEVHPHLKPLSEAEFLQSLEEADMRVQNGGGMTLEEVKRRIALR